MSSSNSPRIGALPEQPVLGYFMRHRRESLGLTQEEVARRMFVSVSLYRKLENGERPISPDRLADWSVAMEAPEWLIRKMVSVAMPKLTSVAAGVWPSALREEDIEHLEALPFPAFYHRIPEYDVLACNQAGRAAFPWLDPDPNSDQPTNVIVQMMTVPEAREALINWELIVSRLIFVLRVNSPGTVAPERLAQIVDACRVNPEFERFWATDMREEDWNDSLVLVRDPETGGRMALTMRSYNAWHPDNCPYQLFMLTPRASPTSSVEPGTEG
ncbi:XRE family transcriptional regulator [Nocardia yunnanensis]|uniref:XRE family transcriptional regulator n=1 Tax=Nocardia yunnanensis TaxID=2382165 RepID=A0A386Z569_9NOCA|nr:helix-turn-helix domain-containing protein [Nocardia yunnanensis]AYF72932.1 XRE family transcriptional regulator [Nocardia yunnanensis]